MTTIKGRRSIDWRAVAVVVFCLVISTSASSQQTPLPSGQVVGWKSFHVASEPFQLPATPNHYTWTQTNYPANPNFTKQNDNSGLWCFAMFDVRPSDTNVIDMAIMIDDGFESVAQGMIGPAPLVNKTNVITFSFGYIFQGVKAGAHEITVWMASALGAPATFISTEANLQCLEINLPTKQQ